MFSSYRHPCRTKMLQADVSHAATAWSLGNEW
jgi:hypothetical protein